MKIDYKKIKNWLINNSKIIYRITAVVLLAILSYGLYVKYNDVLLYFGAVDRDIFWLCIFYTLTFISIIQFLFVLILGKVKRVAKLCCSVIILNMIAMLITIILFSIFRATHCVIIGMLTDLLDSIFGYIYAGIFWPSGRIWGGHDWISSIIFAILASGISTTLQYYFLRKNVKSKKLLLTSLIISSVIVYTCITIFFNIRY